MTWPDWMRRIPRVLYRSRSALRRRADQQGAGWRLEALEQRLLLTIKFNFDYSLDSSHFFDSPQARALLEQAGSLLGGQLSDSLTAIKPTSTNAWIAYFNPPSSGATSSIENLTIAANTLTIFVGARDLLDGSVAESAPGGFYTLSADINWRNLLAGRGQVGAVPQGGAVATDFGPWGGSLAFDSVGTSWHFGSSVDGIGSGQIDFLSVAQHELGHLLGFGTAESFDRYIIGDTFSGPHAISAYDGVGNPPLSGDRAHWADGLVDDGQSAAMDPTLAPTARRLFTGLDFAALEDIGWNSNSGPGNGSGAVNISGPGNPQTSESGTAVFFSTVLGSKPTATVILEVSSSDIAEGQVSTSSLVFTPENWDVPQVVVVTAVDDVVVDGNQTYTIIISAASSEDSNYNGIDPPDITLTNVDNDRAGVTVTPTSGLATTEQGGTSSFTVVLNSEPSSDVAIGVKSSNPNEGTVSLSLLLFTPTSWMIPQTVTVTGVNDQLADADNLYSIMLSSAATFDKLYSGLNPEDVSVLSISIPDLPPVITLSRDEVTVPSKGTPALLDTQAIIIDPDSPFQSLMGGKLVVAVNRNGTSSDRLTIMNTGTGSGQISVPASGTSVSFGGVVIGTSSGGAGTSPLTITFNGRASLAMVQEVLRNLQFRTSATNRSGLDRSVSMQFVLANGKSAGPAIKLVHVLTGPAAPVINTGTDALNYKNRSGSQLISPSATLTDSDSTTFNAGVLTVSLASGMTTDAFKINNQGTGNGQISSTSDGKVKFGATVIGTWTGGTKGKPLVIKLKSTASLTAVQALIRNITFETAASNTSLAPRSARFQLTDGAGGSSVAVMKSIMVS